MQGGVISERVAAVILLYWDIDHQDILRWISARASRIIIITLSILEIDDQNIYCDIDH